jgi:uncharacterized protein (TIGR02453 family)
MPEAAQLKKLRQEIDYNWEEFQQIIKEKSFKKTFGDLYLGDELRLSTMPKGYEKDNPAAAYLKLKCFIAETTFADEELTRSGLHKKTIVAFKALQPLLHFINRSMDS